MEGKNKLALVVLVVAILAVGYAIYNQSERLATPSGSSQPAGQTTSTQSGAGATRTLSDEQRQVLNPPGPDASEEEQAAHFELAKRLAEDSNALNVTACVITPLVLKRANGQAFTMTNSGAETVTLNIGDMTYTIPAKGSVDAQAGFGKGPGLFGYSCSSAAGASPGMIFVTE